MSLLVSAALVIAAVALAASLLSARRARIARREAVDKAFHAAEAAQHAGVTRIGAAIIKARPDLQNAASVIPQKWGNR